MSDSKSAINNYALKYSADYGFEKYMVQARQRAIVELIERIQPRTVLEVGCGLNQLFLLVQGCEWIEKWVIIEPSDLFVQSAREQLNDKRIQCIQGFIEDVVDQEDLGSFDLCIVSGVLHEVEFPKFILESSKKILNTDGILHVNVPNAQSMHRRLAVNMGLINSVDEFSGRNNALSQHRVFNMKSLQKLVMATDMIVTESGGYFVKPFTHAQMEKITDIIGFDFLEGLWLLGKQYPELASEIYVNAKSLARDI